MLRNAMAMPLGGKQRRLLKPNQIRRSDLAQRPSLPLELWIGFDVIILWRFEMAVWAVGLRAPKYSNKGLYNTALR
jgi:hypothetical protein